MKGKGTRSLIARHFIIFPFSRLFSFLFFRLSFLPAYFLRGKRIERKEIMKRKCREGNDDNNNAPFRINVPFPFISFSFPRFPFPLSACAKENVEEGKEIEKERKKEHLLERWPWEPFHRECFYVTGTRFHPQANFLFPLRAAFPFASAGKRKGEMETITHDG